MACTIDGALALGSACSVTYLPNSNAQQINQFFGLNGQQTLFGGTRGSRLLISGVFLAPDLPTLNAIEAALFNYAGPATHTVVDNRGRTFINFIFDGTYQPDPAGPHPAAGGGWALGYKMEMIGLTQ